MTVALVIGALLLVMAAIIGWLVSRLARETAVAKARAEEAEKLHDQLGRRVDLLDAANRCARALASSLEIEEAFAAFIRELRGLVPFDRVAIVLADDGVARVIAAAGAGAETVFPPGSRRPVAGSLLNDVIENGRVVYRPDMDDQRYPEEAVFVSLGLRSRLAAPLLLGSRSTGMISLVRVEPDSFSEDEVELVSSSAGSSAARCRTSVHMRPSGRRSTNCASSRPCAPTSCPSSRTSCEALWPRWSARRRRCASAGGG